jgi:hypothetical protein
MSHSHECKECASEWSHDMERCGYDELFPCPVHQWDDLPQVYSIEPVGYRWWEVGWGHDLPGCPKVLGHTDPCVLPNSPHPKATSDETPCPICGTRLDCFCDGSD